MLSEPGAESVAAAFAAEAIRHASGQVIAVVLIGSLGAGSYVPGRSDIDTAVILSAGASEATVGDLERLATEFASRHAIPRGLGVVPVRVDQLSSPLDPQDELAPELLDLRERGRLLAGSFDLASVPTPTEEDLRAYCRVFIPWLRRERRDPDRDPANATPDAGVNGLLYELRLAVLARTGRYILPKQAVVPALTAADPAIAARLGLERVQPYLTGTSPPPPPNWLDDVRVRIEQDNSRVAPWAFTGER